MNFNVLKYYIKEGYVNLFKNKRSTFASITIMSFTLLLFGIFLVVTKNVENLTNSLRNEQSMQVYINTDAKENEIQELKSQISNIEIEGKKAVVNIKYKSKREAAEDLKDMFKDNPQVISGIGDDYDFLPASFILKLDDISQSEQVKKRIETFDNVSEINSEEGFVNMILKVTRGVNIVIIILVAILLVSSVLIISNTIKLSVFSRRKEISIMKYVGASDDFVKGPFIVESVFIGLISIILPIVLISLIYEFIEQALTNINVSVNVATGAGTSLMIPFSAVLPQLIQVFLVLGIGLSILGSLISMRKYLEV